MLLEYENPLRVARDTAKTLNIPADILAEATGRPKAKTAKKQTTGPDRVGKKDGKMYKARKPYVKEEFSDVEAELPDDPWFVFYHNGSFSIPSSRFTRGTDDPDKVNVVVAYTDSTSRNGVWVDEVTGKEVSDTFVQHVTLSLIRLEDWALIDEVSFSQQLKQGENGVNVLGMDQVQFYLNELGQ